MNNYLLFMPSLMQNGCEPITYTAADAEITFTGLQTNIPATEYIVDQLARSQQKLTKIIMLCSDEVLQKPITPAGAEKSIVTYDYYVEQISQWMRGYGYEEAALEHMFVAYNLRDINPGNFACMEQLQTSILELLENEKNGNLYVDYTGGLRSASMLLIFFARMFEKTMGVKMAQVIYSSIYRLEDGRRKGIIEDCIDTYRLFDFLDMTERKDLDAMKKAAEQRGNTELAKSAEATVKAKKEADAGVFSSISEEDRQKLTSGKSKSVVERMIARTIREERESTTREGSLSKNIKTGNVGEAANLIRNSAVTMMMDKGYLNWKYDFKSNKGTAAEQEKEKQNKINEAFFAYARYYQTYLDFVKKMLESLRSCPDIGTFRREYDAYVDYNISIYPASDREGRNFRMNDRVMREFEEVFPQVKERLDQELLRRIQTPNAGIQEIMDAFEAYNLEKRCYVKTYATAGFPFGNIKDSWSYTRYRYQRVNEVFLDALDRAMDALMKQPYEKMMALVQDILADDVMLTRYFPAARMRVLFELRDNNFRDFSIKVKLLNEIRQSRNGVVHFSSKGLSGAELIDAANQQICSFAQWLQEL